jgi:GlpG protein
MRTGARAAKVPHLTLLLLATAATVSAAPAIANVLVYDRSHVEAGELWRLLTSHLVHFTPMHLLYDVVAIGVGGGMIEQRWGMRRLALLYVMASLGIGFTLLLAAPSLAIYGGLSGIAYAALAYAALGSLSQRPQAVSWVLLGALAGKLLIELGTSSPIFVHGDDLVAVPIAHAAGIATAVALWLTERLLIDSGRPLFRVFRVFRGS